MPFATCPGLSLGRDAWDSGPLKKVWWDDELQLFVCLVTEVYAADGAAFDAQIEQDIKDGWTRLGGDAPGWVGAMVAGDDA